MFHEQFSITIQQPVETVFAFLIDLGNTPRWYKNCLEIKELSEGPVGVGSTMVMVTKAMGRRFETKYECSQFEPNRSYSLKAISGPVAGQATTTLEAIDGGTRITTSAEVEGIAFFKVAEPLIARQFRRDQATNLSNLKRLLEAPVVSGR